LTRTCVSDVSSGYTRSQSVAEAKVIAANVDFYRQFADKYDSYETYLFDPALQQSLEEDVDKIGSRFALLDRAAEPVTSP